MRVSQNGLNSVLVSWTSPSDTTFVTGYIIYYQAHEGESNSLLTVGSDTSATVPGLSLWETYNISVASNSEFFISHQSVPQEITLGILYRWVDKLFHSEAICVLKKNN